MAHWAEVVGRVYAERVSDVSPISADAFCKGNGLVIVKIEGSTAPDMARWPAVNPRRTFKILMILHMPWTRDLGGSRVQFELAEEFRKQGHIVDKFDINDAFPRSNRLTVRFHAAVFHHRAARFVQNMVTVTISSIRIRKICHSPKALAFSWPALCSIGGTCASLRPISATSGAKSSTPTSREESDGWSTRSMGCADACRPCKER
jgi:hypothetical protein